MAEDWAVDVKKYVPNADDEVIKGLIRYCGIALQKRDSSLVSFGDPAETGRVRENFLKKKLGLTDSDETLNAAIAAVGERMKGDNFKNRVTVYYLLLDHLGLLHMFRKDGTAPAAAPVAAPAAPVGLAAGMAGAAAAGVGAVASGASAAMDAGTSAVSAAADTAKDAVAGATAAVAGGAAAVGAGLSSAAAAPMGMMSSSYDGDSGGKGGMGWLWWLLGGLVLLGLLWWFFMRTPAKPVVAADTNIAAPMGDTVDTNAMTTGNDMTAAAPAPVAIPQGAGVTSETRDGKPLVKVYFDTGKTNVVEAFTPAAATLKTYLDANPGTSLGVSGYNDPTGNAAANALLSKNRAKAVQEALVKSGIADTAIALVKPEATTDTQVSKDEARRVEVFIK